MKKITGLLGMAATILCCNGCISEEAGMYLLVGSYSSSAENGIHVLSFDEEKGESHLVSGMNGIANPSFLVPAYNGKRIYSVSETDDETASLFAYSFNSGNGSLQLINKQPTNGAAPCHVWVDSFDQLAITANYNGGSISIFPIATDGSLQEAIVEKYEGGNPDSERQSCPHLHYIYSSPSGEYVYANDLGTDRIYKYNVVTDNEKTHLGKGTPSYFQLPAGEGPRHTTFHPNGKYAYTIGELSGNVTVFTLSPDGNLDPIQTIAADTLSAAGSADIHLSPNGKFLYVSNRLKGDGIAIFSVDNKSGLLTKVGYQPTGIHPRNFAITPNGKYLLCACRDDNKIQIFRINANNGLLHDTGKDIKIEQPVCLKFILK